MVKARSFLFVLLALHLGAGCGSKNSSGEDNTPLACPGIPETGLSIHMTNVLPDFNSPYRVELSSGNVVDTCTGEKDFVVGRNFRSLDADVNPTELWSEIDVRVIHLGDCNDPSDDTIQRDAVNVAITWTPQRIVYKECNIDVTIYGASLDL